MKEEERTKHILSPIAAAKAATPWWMFEIIHCYGLELYPVQVLTRPSEGSTYWEPCQPHEAQFWCVYANLTEGGVICIEDFPTEAEARAFAAQLLSVYPNLCEQGLLK